MKFELRVYVLLASVWFLVGLSPQASAQLTAPTDGWPTRTIRLVVPYAAGGPADVVSRIVAEKLSLRIGQKVIVENVGGAAGNIGAGAVARADPDGYTLLYVNAYLLTNPVQMKGASDFSKDLAPIIHITNVPMVLVTRPDFPAKTAPEVLAEVRRRPGGATCGTSGGVLQIGCELLNYESKGNIRTVLYRGQAPAITDVMSGQIDLAFDLANTIAPHIEAKSVNAIASSAPRDDQSNASRLPLLSDTIPGFELVAWQGLMAPAATPRDILGRLNQEIGAILTDPATNQQLTDSGLSVVGGTPEAFGAFIQKEKLKLGDMLQKVRLQPQ